MCLCIVYEVYKCTLKLLQSSFYTALTAPLNHWTLPLHLHPSHRPLSGRRRRRRVDRGDRLARQPGWSRPPAPPGRRGRPRRPSSPGRGPNDGGAPLRKPDIPSAGGTRCLAHHTRGRSCSPLGPDGGPRPAVVSPSAVMCPSAARRGCRPPSGTSRRVRGWTTAGGGTLLHWRQPSFWPGARNSNALRALALSTGTSDWSSAAVLVQPGGRRVRCRPGLLVPAPTAGLLLSYGCWSYAGAARRRQSVLSPVRSVTFLEVAVLIWSPSGGEWGGHAPVLPPGKRWRQSGSRVWWPAAHAGCCMPPLGDLLRAPHSIAAGRTCPLRCSWTNVPAPTYVAPLSLTHQTILLSCRWVAAGRWHRVLPLCACRGEGVHASDGCRQISDEACRDLLLGPGPGQSGTLGCGCWSAHLLHFSRQSALEDLKNCSILWLAGLAVQSCQQ